MTVNMMLLAAIFCGLMALFIRADNKDEPINRKIRLSRRQIELKREQARKEGYALDLDEYLHGTETYSKGGFFYDKQEINI